MPTFELNTDSLEEEKGKLLVRLKQIDSLLDMAKNFGVLKASRTQVPAESQHVSRAGFRQGSERMVILTLDTGKAKGSEISKVLMWDDRKTRIVLASAVRRGTVVYDSSKDYYELSAEGKQRASWFRQHPKQVVFRPNGFNFESRRPVQ